MASKIQTCSKTGPIAVFMALLEAAWDAASKSLDKWPQMCYNIGTGASASFKTSGLEIPLDSKNIGFFKSFLIPLEENHNEENTCKSNN